MRTKRDDSVRILGLLLELDNEAPLDLTKVKVGENRS